jgi:hypothetical protein
MSVHHIPYKLNHVESDKRPRFFPIASIGCLTSCWVVMCEDVLHKLHISIAALGLCMVLGGIKHPETSLRIKKKKVYCGFYVFVS